MAGKERLKVIKGNLGKELRAQVKPKAVVIPDLVFRADYVVETKLAKKLDTDARFVAKLYDDATRLYKELMMKLAKLYVEADGLASIIPLSDQEKRGIDQKVSKLFDEYQGKITKVIEGHVNQWLQVRKDRTKYKRNVAWNITKGTVGIASGAGSFAAGTVTGGLSGVLAIVSILKGVYKIVKEIKRMAQDLDAAQQQLQKTMASLSDSYLHSKKWKVGSKELGKHAVESFFVYEMASINRADKEFVTFKGKAAPLHKQSAELGKSLHKILDKQSGVDKKIDQQITKKLKKRKFVSKTMPKLQRDLTENRKQVMKLIDDLSQLNSELDKLESFQRNAEQMLLGLKAKKPTWVKKAEKVVSIASLLSNPCILAIANDGESLMKYSELLTKSVGNVAAEIAT